MHDERTANQKKGSHETCNPRDKKATHVRKWHEMHQIMHFDGSKHYSLRSISKQKSVNTYQLFYMSKHVILNFISWWTAFCIYMIIYVYNLHLNHIDGRINYDYRQVSNIKSTLVGNKIVDRRCSNYIFILHLTPGFIGLGKDNCKTRRETFKFWDLVRVILKSLR